MNRKIWFAICLTLALGARVHQHLNGTAEYSSMLLEPVVIVYGAFVAPAIAPVLLMEHYGFHYEPWAGGHHMATLLWMLLTASAIWFFPMGRIRRWFGHHDAFQAADSQRPQLARMIAAAVDAIDRRRFGREKTGRWA